MTDIKIVVKIDADVYTRLFDNGIQDNEIATDDICEMARALRLGKPYEESKTGKWIYHIDDLFPAESTKECDQCRTHQDLNCDGNFCPWCGAKMEEA